GCVGGTDDHELCAVNTIADGLRLYRSVLHEGFRFFGSAIPNGHWISVLEQVADHPLAHDPRTDEGDLRLHERIECGSDNSVEMKFCHLAKGSALTIISS